LNCVIKLHHPASKRGSRPTHPHLFLGGRVAVTECTVAFATYKVSRSIKWFVWPCALPWHPVLSRFTLALLQASGNPLWNTKCAIEQTLTKKKNIYQCV